MRPDPVDTLAVESAQLVLRRILVVDDSPLQLKILSSLLKRRGFEVFQADSAEEALEMCESLHPDAVLSDWMMPGMDGLEFCRRFRDMRRESYGYFILLTSKSEKGEIARGLDAGADDFLTKPVNADELYARINAGARILAMERKLSETLTHLQTAYDAIDRDLRQARNIQQALVPRRSQVFGNTRVSLLLQPCGHVGGDLVGMFSPDGTRAGVYSIDVSGHGITSAMMTARVAGYLGGDFPDQNIALERQSQQLLSFLPPEDVAAKLNSRLSADPGVVEYLTMVYLSAELLTGRFEMVQAGHPPPLLLRATGEAQFVGNGGLPIGLVDTAQYERLEFTMNPGDRLLLYSDGITEAILENGVMLDQQGLLDMVQSIAPDSKGTEFLDDLFWRLTQSTRSGARLEDDVSAALIEFGAV